MNQKNINQNNSINNTNSAAKVPSLNFPFQNNANDDDYIAPAVGSHQQQQKLKDILLDNT